MIMISSISSIKSSLLLLFLMFFSSTSARKDVVVPLASANEITQNIRRVEKLGYTLPWMNLALSKLQESSMYQKSYDAFFRHSPVCKSQPSELISTYALTIQRSDLKDLLNEDFVKELPDQVQNRLKLLKYEKDNLVMTDTYSKITNEAKSGHESLEIGHFMLKATIEGDRIHILYLGPALKTTVDIKCTFTDNFREKFLGLSQDVQNLLAIKAAANGGFVNTLESYSASIGSDIKFDHLGFEKVPTKSGGDVWKQNVPVPLGSDNKIPEKEL